MRFTHDDENPLECLSCPLDKIKKLFAVRVSGVASDEHRASFDRDVCTIDADVFLTIEYAATKTPWRLVSDKKYGCVCAAQIFLFVRTDPTTARHPRARNDDLGIFLTVYAV